MPTSSAKVGKWCCTERHRKRADRHGWCSRCCRAHEEEAEAAAVRGASSYQPLRGRPQGRSLSRSGHGSGCPTAARPGRYTAPRAPDARATETPRGARCCSLGKKAAAATPRVESGDAPRATRTSDNSVERNLQGRILGRGHPLPHSARSSQRKVHEEQPFSKE